VTLKSYVITQIHNCTVEENYQQTINNNYNKNNASFINPFSPQHPADLKYFVDRRDHLEYFSNAIVSSVKLSPPSPSNFLILGDWLGRGMNLNPMLTPVLSPCRGPWRGGYARRRR
jgi:hypothetical protein